MDQGAGNLVEAHRGAGAIISRRVGDGFHGQDARTRVIDEGNAEPLAIGSVMNESFDQQAGHRPLPSTGSRQAAHSGGSARSSAVPQHHERRRGGML